MTNQIDENTFNTKENFAELFESSVKSSSKKEGSLVKGTVVRVDGDAVTVDIGLKTEGRIPVKEFVKNGLFEELSDEILNPRLRLKLVDLNDGSHLYCSYIYYNNRNFGGTRLEYRLTGLTRWIKNYGLHSGDVIQISRIGALDYSVGILKDKRKPSTLSAESWVALYGEDK